MVGPSESERGNFQNCPVCGWEDDYVARADPHARLNGMTLIEAQENYLRVGACDERLVDSVRAPRADEFPPDAAWPEAR